MKIFEAEDRVYLFYCPGCNRGHAVNWQWGFNGNFERPTFSSHSVGIGNPNDADYCHSMIKDGMIQFIGDSKHALSGQTVDLPHFPEIYGLPKSLNN